MRVEKQTQTKKTKTNALLEEFSLEEINQMLEIPSIDTNAIITGPRKMHNLAPDRVLESLVERHLALQTEIILTSESNDIHAYSADLRSHFIALFLTMANDERALDTRDIMAKLYQVGLNTHPNSQSLLSNINRQLEGRTDLDFFHNLMAKYRVEFYAWTTLASFQPDGTTLMDIKPSTTNQYLYEEIDFYAFLDVGDEILKIPIQVKGEKDARPNFRIAQGIIQLKLPSNIVQINSFRNKLWPQVGIDRGIAKTTARNLGFKEMYNALNSMRSETFER